MLRIVAYCARVKEVRQVLRGQGTEGLVSEKEALVSNVRPGFLRMTVFKGTTPDSREVLMVSRLRKHRAGGHALTDAVCMGSMEHVEALA